MDVAGSPPASATRPRHRFVRNGFLLVVPLLVWNVVWEPRLPAGAGGTEPVPLALEILEHALRIVVFAWPLWLWLDWRGRDGRIGVVVYLVGLAGYILTWLPWLAGEEIASVLVLLGPYVSPLAVFAGIGLLGRSTPYLGVAASFVVVHSVGGLIRGGVL